MKGALEITQRRDSTGKSRVVLSLLGLHIPLYPGTDKVYLEQFFVSDHRGHHQLCWPCGPNCGSRWRRWRSDNQVGELPVPA